MGDTNKLFRLEDSIGYLYLQDLNTILQFKEKISRIVEEGRLIVLVLIWTNGENSILLDQSVREELLHWFNSLMAVSIMAVDTDCGEGLLELFMMCDIRLGGEYLSIRFPQYKEDFIFDFETRCQLIIGNKRLDFPIENLLNKVLQAAELCRLRFINRLIDSDSLAKEVKNFAEQIMNGKNHDQVKSILICFQSYKRLGLKVNKDLLLEQEGKQFCMLVHKLVQAERVKYGD